jgi:serine/threonine protein kinase
MLLNPDQARKLAGVLLEAETEETLPAPRLGGRSFGNYQVLRLIGIGGMGEVYEANQDRTGRRVAIKVIRPELISADLSRRFEHEVRVLARLQHPGIAQVFEAGRVDTAGGSTPYFAMEFVEGRPLTKFAAEQQLSVRDRLGLFLKVCDAVEHAHRKGVIHRDLKPGNILVDAAGQPRILDFGVARATDADIAATTLHTDIGKVIGTLPYMSPEQVSGDPDALDTRSDVYSLGVVLYELLAGKPPYEILRGQVHEAARVIREVEPARLGTLNAACRGDLETIVGKALEKERHRRYQSVGDLGKDIRHSLASEPISARPSSVLHSLLRAARRHRVAAIFALLAVVALTSTAVVASVAALKQRSARATLQKALDREKERSETATVVTEFLQTLLGSADPSRRGESIRVGELLDEAARKLDRGEVKSPQVEGALREAIGLAYLGNGALDSAARCLNRSHELALQEFGPDDPRTLTTEENVGLLLQNQGKLDDALAVMRRNVEARTRVAGPNDEATLHARYGLALTLSDSGDKPGALAYLEHLRDDSTASLGPRHETTLQVRAEVGNLLADMGRTDEAERVLAEVLDDERSALGVASQETVATMNNLAIILSRAKKYSQARALYAEVLKESEGLYGPDAPAVLVTAANLAQTTFREGDLAAAESQMRQVIQRAESTLGPDHPTTLGFRFNLAKLLRAQNRYDEYEPMLKDIVQRSQKVLPPRSMDLGLYIRNYGECLLTLKRLEEADHYLTLAFETFKDSVGRTHELTRGTARALIALYKEQNNAQKVQEYQDFLAAVHNEMKESGQAPAQPPQDSSKK